MQSIKEIIKKYFISSIIAISLLCGFMACLVVNGFERILHLNDVWVMTIIIGAFIFPLLLTIANLINMFLIPGVHVQDEVWLKNIKKIEIVTIVLGGFYSVLWMEVLSNIVFDAQWFDVIYNNEFHQPIWTDAMPTIIAFSCIGIIGYLILSFIKLEKTPPLITVLAISAMYLGILESIIWSIQIFTADNWILCVFPINCIFIAIKIIRWKIVEWNRLNQDNEKLPGLMNTFRYYIKKSEYWPIIAFILMWPLLGIVLCILIIFGQKPDYIIKAWTQTADWNLSEQIAPQNLYRDEHYLCTVAAGGHKEIVKPIRMGERHGHRVIVNRQLCIANAFEQILEEKVPGIHKVIRGIYDKYGFPIAKLIKTKKAADVIYFIMKPLEWIFLIIIYLCDSKPENRIAIQYLPITIEEIESRYREKR